jgi:hypothetical protein
VVAADEVVADAELVVGAASVPAGPSTAPASAPVPAANGSQIAIKVGFRLGTLRLPVPFKDGLLTRCKERKTKVNERRHPILTFVFLHFMLLIFSNKSIGREQPSVNKGP